MTATKLNLGSGSSPIEGYHNLDIKTCDEIYPLPVDDGTVDEVRASHVLEHFPHGQVADVVKEWARVLKPGGRLKIAVPDFDWIVKAYTNGHRGDNRLERHLFGGQVDGDDYHKAFFNEEKLKALLEGAGLVDVKQWESDAADCSSYQVSLNLEGRKPNPDPTCEFIKDSKGIIHVGANTGQARDIYAGFGLPVVWIEAIPEVFRRLGENIAAYPNQRALNYLIADRDGEEYTFHVASNDGQSSSIFDLGRHVDVWPDIHYVQTEKMLGVGLRTALERHSVNLDEYDTLIMDVQGAELLVLKGAEAILDKFKFIRAEACDFEMYKGGCRLADLDAYLIPRGFERVMAWQFKRARGPQAESVYEALYQRRAGTKKAREIAPIYIHDEKTGAKALYRVAAMASVPRLGFQAHMGASERAFVDPHIPVLRLSGCVFWEMTMQNGFNSLIKAGADYIVTTDYDTIFTPEDVKELLRLIVRYPEADAIAAWQASRWKDHPPLAGIKTERGWGGAVPIEEMKRSDLTEVDNTVYALTIIKTEALKKIPKPWFQNVPNAEGEWEHGKHDADSYFWWKFREAGNKLYMANTVRVGHLHEDILWVDNDFNLIKQDLIEYYSKGRPF
jgi:FkbM family methyltransferase